MKNASYIIPLIKGNNALLYENDKVYVYHFMLKEGMIKRNGVLKRDKKQNWYIEFNDDLGVLSIKETAIFKAKI